MNHPILLFFNKLKAALSGAVSNAFRHLGQPQHPGHHKRAFGLDLVRAFAILVVVCAHGLTYFPNTPKYCYLFLVDGVSIFFVLSGILIGSILIKTVDESEYGPKDILVFWKRRWFRTLPTYYLVLIVLTLHEIHAHGLKFITLSLGRIFLFSQNIFGTGNLHFFGESWSLAVEEWFYLTIPVFIFVGLKLGLKKNPAVLWATGIFLLVPMGIRILYYFHNPAMNLEALDDNMRKVVVTRLDAIGFGVLGSFIKRYLPQYWNRKPLLYGIVGVCLLAFRQWWHVHTITYGAFEMIFLFQIESLGALLIIGALENFTIRDGIVYRFITWTSLISYSVYLLHYSTIQNQLIEAVNKRTTWCHGWNAFILYVVLVYVLASLVHIFWENPTMNLRDKSRALPLLKKKSDSPAH